MPYIDLHPNAAGYYTDIDGTTGTPHWGEVSEATNDDTDYVWTSNVLDTEQDSYRLDNSPSGMRAVIQNVDVHFRGLQENAGSNWGITPFLRITGTGGESFGSKQVLTTSATTYVQTIARPNGGSWSWSEIDDLEVGVRLDPGGFIFWCRCTRVFVRVHYKTGIPYVSIIGLGQ